MDIVCSAIDREFALLHKASVKLVMAMTVDILYKAPTSQFDQDVLPSAGETILRSAGIVEQTFGGLTTNLWDDPFEWTLPETLTTPALVVEYLTEVESTRTRGFSIIRSDADLYKEVAVPAGNTVPLIQVIIQAFGAASHHQGRAFYAFRLNSDKRLPAGASLREPFVCDNR